MPVLWAMHVGDGKRRMRWKGVGELAELLGGALWMMRAYDRQVRLMQYYHGMVSSAIESRVGLMELEMPLS
jgi:hypothetical protein